MKPGRELDSLIANKIFGDATILWPGSDVALSLSMKRPGKELPHYSTNIADAFEVVEKMRSPGSHRDCFSLYSPTDNVKDWFACFDRKWHGRSLESVGPDSYLEFESGESAAHAICLAALKAVKAPE